VDLLPADPPNAARLWAFLDKPWQEASAKPTRIGPRRDELGTFATSISEFGPALTPGYEKGAPIISRPWSPGRALRKVSERSVMSRAHSRNTRPC
jgi:hypothetical protein